MEKLDFINVKFRMNVKNLWKNNHRLLTRRTENILDG